jgi:hypothetical protein
MEDYQCTLGAKSFESVGARNRPGVEVQQVKELRVFNVAI